MTPQEVMPNVPYSSTTGSCPGVPVQALVPVAEAAVVVVVVVVVVDGDRFAWWARTVAGHPPTAVTARQRTKSGTRRMGHEHERIDPRRTSLVCVVPYTSL